MIEGSSSESTGRERIECRLQVGNGGREGGEEGRATQGRSDRQRKARAGERKEGGNLKGKGERSGAQWPVGSSERRRPNTHCALALQRSAIHRSPRHPDTELIVELKHISEVAGHSVSHIMSAICWCCRFPANQAVILSSEGVTKSIHYLILGSCWWGPNTHPRIRHPLADWVT